MDIDDRLRAAGQHWRDSQEPALPPPSLESSGENVPRRRWRRGLVPVAASAAAAGIVFAIASLHGATTGSQEVPAGTTNRPSASNPASTGPAVAACGAAQLSGKTVRSVGQASQSMDEVVLTNVGSQPCRLEGYPKLEAWGPLGAGPSAKLNISLTHGGNYFTSDPGPTTVDIAAGQSAWFAVSTASAYGSEIVVVDRVSIVIGPTTGSGSGHVDVAVGMGASFPPGQAIPVTVSAFAGGIPQVPGSSTSTTPQPSNTVTAPPATACISSQLLPSLGVAGPAAGTGHTQILLKNVSGQSCYLGGVLPLQGIAASGKLTRLVFPGDSATSYPSPVVPGDVAPGHFGAFWVSTQLNGCPNGVRYAALLIEFTPREQIKIPWPMNLSNGCLSTESAAGPFPQPIPSIP